MSESLVEKYTVAIVKFLAESKTMLFYGAVSTACMSYEMFKQLPDNFKYPIGVLILGYLSISIFKKFIYITTKKEIKMACVSLPTSVSKDKKDVQE